MPSIGLKYNACGDNLEINAKSFALETIFLYFQTTGLHHQLMFPNIVGNGFVCGQRRERSLCRQIK